MPAGWTTFRDRFRDHLVEIGSQIVSPAGPRSLAKGQTVGIASSHERRDAPETPQIRVPPCQRLLQIQEERPGRPKEAARQGHDLQTTRQLPQGSDGKPAARAQTGRDTVRSGGREVGQAEKPRDHPGCAWRRGRRARACKSRPTVLGHRRRPERARPRA